MYVYKSVHRGDFNKNGKLNFTKLFLHGYKFLNAILTEMKLNRKENVFICKFIFSRKRMRMFALLRTTVAISAEIFPAQ